MIVEEISPHFRLEIISKLSSVFPADGPWQILLNFHELVIGKSLGKWLKISQFRKYLIGKK